MLDLLAFLQDFPMKLATFDGILLIIQRAMQGNFTTT